MAAGVTQRIYELQVKLAASSLAQLKKLQAEAAKTNQKLDGINKVAGDVAKGLLAGFTLDRFIQGISGAIEYVDDLAASAEKLGVTVETLSALQFAAQQTDVSMGGLATGLKELQKSIAAMGTSDKGGSILEALGVETAGKELDEVLTQFADAFTRIKDPVTQSNALLEVFGRSGLELRPLLNQGAEGITQLMEEAARLGLVVDQEAVKSLGELDNQMNIVQNQVRGLFVDIATGLAPSLLDLADNFSDAQKKGEGFKKFGEAVGVVFKTVAGGALVVATAFEDVGSALGALGAMSAQIAEGEFKQAWDIIGMSQEESKKRWAELAVRLDDLATTTKEETNVAEENAKGKEHQADATGKVNEILKKTNETTAKQRDLVAERLQQMDDELAQLQLRGALDTEYMKLQSDLERGKLKATDAQRAALEAGAEAIDQEKELIAEEERHAAELEKIQTALEAIQTPLEIYTAKTAEYVGWLNAGNVSQEEFNRLITEEYEKMTTANEAAEKRNKDLEGTDAILGELADKVDGYAQSISGALVDFAAGTGDVKTSFSDMVTSILRDLATMATQMLVMEPLMENFKAGLKGAQGASKGGGGIGEIFGALFKGFMASADGNVFSGGHVMAFAKGGIVTGPTIFPMANGAGLMGEAGPEAVMPLTRDSQGRLGVSTEGSGVTVNIYNQAGAEVQTETQTGPSGEKVLNVTIVKAVEQAINTGRLDSTLNNAFGITRRGR